MLLKLWPFPRTHTVLLAAAGGSLFTAGSFQSESLQGCFWTNVILKHTNKQTIRQTDRQSGLDFLASLWLYHFIYDYCVIMNTLINPLFHFSLKPILSASCCTVLLQAKQSKLVNHVIVRRVLLNQHHVIVELEEGSASWLETLEILSEDNLISRSHVKFLCLLHIWGASWNLRMARQTQTSGDGCWKSEVWSQSRCWIAAFVWWNLTVSPRELSTAIRRWGPGWMKRCGMVLTWFHFQMWVIVCLCRCRQSSAQPAV